MKPYRYFMFIILLTAPSVSFSQKSNAHKKKDRKIAPVSSAVLPVERDTLSRFYDSLLMNPLSVHRSLEVYKVTFTSFSPAETTIQYYTVTENTLVSSEFLLDRIDGVEYRHEKRIAYGADLAERFRPLIDSAFWNYHEPKSYPGAVFDGGRTRIEGLKNNEKKLLERSNASGYDNLFRLLETFFEQY